MPLHFHNPNCAYNHLYNSHNLKICSSTLVNFYLPISPLLVGKIFSTNTPFLYTSAILYLLIFAYNHPNSLH